jgi:hypothetical protein
LGQHELLPASILEDRNALEEWILKRATLFTVIVFEGRGRKDRKEFDSLQQAIEHAVKTPRGMVYAATVSGRAVMVAPAQYTRALEIVGSEV